MQKFIYISILRFIMKKKNSFILMIMISCFILLCSNSYANIEYLDSCGKNSGWTDNTIYVLNFTEIPSTYGSDYCYLFNQAQNNYNITFTSVKGQIEDKTSSGVKFISTTRGSQTVSYGIIGLTLKNLSFDKLNYLLFLNTPSRGLNYISNMVVDNVTSVNHRNHIFYVKGYMTPSTSSFYSRGGRINNLNITNSFFENENSGDYMFLNTRSGEISSQIKDVYIDDSVIISSKFAYYSSTSGRIWFQGRTTTNSVIIVDDSNTLALDNVYSDGEMLYTSSIVKGYIHEDSDLNNVADSNIHARITSANIYKDLFGYRFIQDFNIGRNFVSDENLNIVNINDETVGFPNEFILFSNDYNNIDTSYSDITFNNVMALDLGNSNTLQCSLTETYCVFEESSFSSTLTSGFITTNSDNVISGIFFEKVFGNNLGVPIKNSADVYKNNVTIEYNYLQISNSVDNSSIIELKGNNFDISNNIFGVGGFEGSRYKSLDIESLSSTTNNIYLNNFTSLLSGYQIGEVFKDNCDTYFYNNYISGYYNITNSCNGVLPYKQVGYQYSGDIYYFTIGNYYVTNNCTDSDGDGICDNSYISGIVTDLYPLSSYPYDFESHLLEADYVVEELDFNITIVNPIDNSSYDINEDDNIGLTFNHDSEFQDLYCYYIIDGVVVEDVFASTNNDYSTSITGFSSKDYSFRVECGNDFVYKVSDEIVFSVDIGDTGTGDNGDDGDDGNGTIIGSGDSLNELFSGDINSVGDSISEFFGISSTPLFWAMVIGFVLLGISFIILMFAVVGLLIR